MFHRISSAGPSEIVVLIWIFMLTNFGTFSLELAIDLVDSVIQLSTESLSMTVVSIQLCVPTHSTELFCDIFKRNSYETRQERLKGIINYTVML
ncbi:hypothetical protein GJ496_000663 [Pomphorhynchus laevis]|nr:hypothetical protein GJ496_000663 [Pomphorhynchus laevis]